MHKNKTRIIYKIKILLVVLVIFCSFAVLNISFAQSFIGPSCAAGQCQGKIGVDSSGNVSMGTSTPQSGTKTLIISQSLDSSSYGLRVLSSNNSPLFLVRSDGKISIATSGASYALNVSGDIYASGNLVVGGTFSAPIPAGNVTPGVFNSLQGGGTGAYAFLGSLGVATSSQVGLPQSLSVYGGGYFSGNVGIGTTTPENGLHVFTAAGTSRLAVYSGPAIASFGSDAQYFINISQNSFSALNTTNGRYVGLSGVIEDNNATGPSIYGVTGLAVGSSNTGTRNGIIGIGGDAYNTGSTNWTDIIGVYSYAANKGAGTVTHLQGMRIYANSNTGTGSVTNNYGLRIDAQNIAGANNYQIYSSGTAPSYLAGNVGIGTTSPGQKLSVVGDIGLSGANRFIGTTDNYALSLRTNNTDRIYITNSGNVGIGTTTPAYKLDVVGQINSSGGLCIAGDCKTSWSQVGGSSQWTNTTGGIYYLGNVGIGTSTVSYPLFVSTSTDTLFAIRRTGASSPTIFKQGTDAGFVINNGGSDILTIKSGNVGIGTTNPGAKLDVNGAFYQRPAAASNFSNYMHVNAANVASNTQLNPGIMLYNSGTDNYGMDLGYNAGSSPNYRLRFFTSAYDIAFSDYDNGGGTQANFTDLMVIKNSGNVGIGTTSPSQKLSVVGDIGLSGANRFIGTTDNYALSLRTNNTDRIYITNSGNVGIGTTTPVYNYKLDVSGDIRTTGCLVYNGGTLGTCASDIRLKDNIMDLTFDNAIEKVIKLQPKKFVFKQDPNHEMHGLIAQEVEEFAPELITTDQNGYKQIKYGDVQWLTVEAIKDLNNKVIQLEKENQNLKQEIQKLKDKLN